MYETGVELLAAAIDSEQRMLRRTPPECTGSQCMPFAIYPDRTADRGWSEKIKNAEQNVSLLKCVTRPEVARHLRVRLNCTVHKLDERAAGGIGLGMIITTKYYTMVGETIQCHDISV